MSDTDEQDAVKEARELLETHSIVAMRVDKPYKEIRPLIGTLCDELERLRGAIRKTLDENGHLADGDNCTLIHLKRAIGEDSDA